MLIVIFGENCTGKSTLADKIKSIMPCKITAGKDYLRLAKNEEIARKIFIDKLLDSVNGENLIHIISDKEQLRWIPEGAVRILVTADIETIKSRFAKRIGGKLPEPVKNMLERNHGSFDNEPHELHVVSNETDLDLLCDQLISGNFS